MLQYDKLHMSKSFGLIVFEVQFCPSCRGVNSPSLTDTICGVEVAAFASRGARWCVVRATLLPGVAVDDVRHLPEARGVG